MHYLFERSDTLNTPVECFLFDAARECFPIRPHWHYFVELIFMLEGSAQMQADESSYFLSEGDMILFHPNTVHAIYAVDGHLPKYAVLKFDINQLNLTPNYAPKMRSIFRSAHRKNMPVLFSKDNACALNARTCFLRCIQEMDTQRYGYDLSIKAELSQLLLGMTRQWIDLGFSIDNDTFLEDTHYDIFNITEYIDAKLGSNLKVSEIAAQCGMSYSYFAKRFLAVYGKSCKKYMETMRLFKAEEYLLFTDFDLNYISQETGFSDCSHLINCFKQYKGITPKQFRLQRHGADS